MKEQYNNYLYLLILATLFLSSIGILGLNQQVGIIFVLICFMLLSTSKSGIPLSLQFLLVIGFSITYYLITKYNKIAGTGFYLFLPWLYYLIGFKIAQIEVYHKGFLVNAIYCIAFGKCLRVFLSFFLNRSLQQGRDVVDIWTGQVMGATNVNAQCIFIIVIIYFLLRYENNKFRKIMGLISVILSVYIALFTSTRTNLGLILIMLLLGVLFDSKIIGSTKLIREAFSNVKWLIALIYFIAILLLFQDKISSFISTTPLVNRLDTYVTVDKDPRWMLMYSVWSNVLHYPLGNMPLFYAHNIFLDCLRVAGIYPTIFLVLFILADIKNLLSISALKTVPVSKKLVILLLCTGLIISFQIEPVLEGLQYSFLILCMLSGVTKFWTGKFVYCTF